MRLDSSLNELASRLNSQGYLLCVAESCTGGMLSENITAIAGSSNWFDRGFITYSNAAKIQMLGVKEKTLMHHGAVSESTAIEMAEGSLQHSESQLCVAITGIAGPTGGSQEKPVGTVCFAWSIKQNEHIGQKTIARTQSFSGDRNAVRKQATIHAVLGLINLLDESTKSH